MAFITTKKQLEAYKERIEHQMELLPLSLIFSEEDKGAIYTIYRDLIEICDRRIKSFPEKYNPFL
ncbi:hypothetical protein [Flavobacterium laiguense]|uniref:Uncharacterized protein n=1 Tax=Flavobacterium laiguense TaxID=2169409 RepID=A0A2U1JWD8_9FLAO|nr:hypothetical protein [Flavobacterium laiguense]PWA09530.1 hypothetical protein DB891_07560 [Flavobacterium laiguense]